ncbi:putative methyltransferase [Gloeomargarita lithophora Alchichica-D10]|uniref:Putative methyltransferase n=1 Tax=Gloeomargarita lithophora Alchichica-D10 TaxID=1188229 RepID=A0A1J0AEE9_9CYAN|nr:methyltransferase domain-containing protein [Gloeomargarita lithophora]APB34287.1 putative methyltransferase [Gloeomargarita lithophora Alchichica-D10]
MSQQYCTSTFIRRTGGTTQAVFGWSQRAAVPLSSPMQLAILECFVQAQTLASGYQIYQEWQTQPVGIELSTLGENLLLKIMQNEIIYLTQGFPSYLQPEQQVNLTDKLPLFSPYPAVNLPEFQATFQQLYELGLIVPAVGQINWGDVRRWAPVCAITGFSRGTPIDRYYQKQFLQTVGDKIKGNILEIGGVAKDREFYDLNLAQITTYRCMNIEAGAGVDFVGDAHDPNMVMADSVDAILIFNVLEHCYDPSCVIDNIHQWLKPGGWCLALVPTAQRLHDRPADYWRLLPDGLTYLFRHYAQCNLYTYGNTLTVLATFLGVAMEELTLQELATQHPDYPVIACVAAQK